MTKFPRLLSPIRLGPVEIRNRVFLAPHGLNAVIPHPDNPDVYVPSERHTFYYGERARGRIGLIIIEATSIDASSDVYPIKTPSAYDPICIDSFRSVVDTVHSYGTKLFVQLWHGGHHAANRRTGKGQYAPSQLSSVTGFRTPREMTQQDIIAIEDGFRTSARNLKLAGVDGIEIHADHSYLVEQFLSPFYNKRTDDYGGSLENRMRFLIEILLAVKEELSEQALGIRINCDELLPDGLTLDDMKQVAHLLEEQKAVDFFDADVGTYHTLPLMISSMYVPPLAALDFISEIKTSLEKTPLLGCPIRLTDPGDAERILAQGSMDMIGAARGFITEPEFVRKVEEDRIDEIRKCIACNQACIGNYVQGLPVGCVINPSSGNEKLLSDRDISRTPNPKKVLIIGGGPSGLEAGRVAAIAGHNVTIVEKEEELGGQLRLAARLPSREIMSTTIDWYKLQLSKLGVKIRLGTLVDEDMIKPGEYDCVVLATGATYVREGYSGFLSKPIPGWNLPQVMIPEDVLTSTRETGNHTVILDEEGFVTSIGIAEMLADQGKSVEIVTRWNFVGPQLDSTLQLPIAYARIMKKGVKMRPNSYIKEIRDEAVVVFNIFTNEETIIEPVEGVILITSKKSNDSLHKTIRGKVGEIFLIGDCAEPRQLGEAILEGNKIGRKL